MNKQQKLDIISSILDHPQWEAEYLFELIMAVVTSSNSKSVVGEKE
jgi:hypothetical protein